MLNIIWIIVDSVRNYACPAGRVDDRGRLKLMDELANSWIDFRKVVASAPSTVMSVGSMFTSCPAYYLGVNFVNFKLDDCGRPTIGSILSSHGYKTYFITLLANEREAWDSILESVPRRVWPKEAKHRNEWKNPVITQTVKNLVDYGMQEPFFFFLHYNCRGDEQISENVRDGLEALEVGGYIENSVVFLTSDHGYPDPFRKDEVARLRKQAALKHRQKAHDLILTDDNILVPLLVKYPGHTPRRIEQQVSAIDYLPTALELAGITDYPDMQGKSLVPLLEGKDMPELEERKVRIDGRFLGQQGRCTAIRSDKRKYMYYHDLPENEREQFYDLTKDELEMNNIIEAGIEGYEDEIEEFRKVFAQEETYGLSLQKNFMKQKYLNELRRFPVPFRSNSGKQILYVRSGAPGFDRLFEEILQDIHGEENVECAELSEAGNNTKNRYDLILGAMSEKLGNRMLCSKIAKIKAPKKALMDLNINIVRFFRLYILPLFVMDWRLRKRYYLREPLYLWDKIWKVLKRIWFG